MNSFYRKPLHQFRTVSRHGIAVLKLIPSLLIFIALLCSCQTQDKITYFQDIDQIPESAWNIENPIMPQLQENDELNIVVSAIDQAAVATFNKPAYTQSDSHSREVSTVPNIQTYRVNPDGDIIFPVLGKLHVKGMTAMELEKYLTDRISEYVKDPMVSVSMYSFLVTVLGEVSSPGTVYFNNRGTLLQAIGTRGDLTIYGNRKNIILLREVNGHRETHRIDLTSADFVNSPYYYLRQNDVIYVSPNNARRASSAYNSMKQQNLSTISTVVSVISVIATLTLAITK